MTNNTNFYYTAADIQIMLGVSRTKAYKIVKDLNVELAQRGFIVVTGRLPKKYFAEKFYGIAQ